MVRKEAIEAIGSMKIRELKANLEELITSNRSSAEEKKAAITSLLQLMEDKINRQDINRLASSNRAGLRLLACQAIAHFQLSRDLDLLFKLSKDRHPDVKSAAFQAIGLVRPSEHIDEVINCAREGTLNIQPQVSLSAAWLLTLYLPEEGRQPFNQFLYDSRQEVRILAASALRATGKYGKSLTLEHFANHPDPFVRLNLALGLIDQRTDVANACICLKEMIKTNKDPWIEKEIGLFQMVAHNKTRKNSDDDEIVTPEMENQMLRIELLNLLTILSDTDALPTIRGYLLERSWGISAAAAATLLIEGDEPAITLVQDLLNDEQPKVRLQAALVLSLWGREEAAIQALEEGYSSANHDLKSRILEGLGRIGAARSIPFLINTLHEPSQTLRVIAAMALIQCLNH
jgi:HEAT repeat protein